MDSDCNIPGYNIMSGGTCTGVGPVTFNGNTLRLTAEANVLFGVYDNAALFANMTDTFVYSGNTVSGGASGIRINADAINGTVERNVVSGAGMRCTCLSRPSRPRSGSMISRIIPPRFERPTPSPSTRTSLPTKVTIGGCRAPDSIRLGYSSTTVQSIRFFLMENPMANRLHERRMAFCQCRVALL